MVNNSRLVIVQQNVAPVLPKEIIDCTHTYPKPDTSDTMLPSAAA